MRRRQAWLCMLRVAGILGVVAMSLVFTGARASAAGGSQLPVSAISVSGARTTPSTSTQGQGHITIIVLDMSGSMAQNDPAGIRCSAANGYIDLSGPGDFIGVIGLDNNGGARGGAHNFQLAQVYAQPVEMATLSARESLKRTIASKSNNCQPDASTPTYDSLVQALNMLESATRAGQISGSVILLTDGDPDPDTDAQINAIKHDLVPRFQQHNWPIDTIALGNDQSFHGFLSDVSNATSGKFYDDGKGAVPGVSPLNIAPFFVDIFARHNGRVVGPTIAPTALGGGTVSRNFQVGQYVDHLDVIAVKDQPGTRVTLNAPSGQTVNANIAGGQVLPDPHYAIFSIQGPQTGTWQLNATGSGTFLMDSLITSSLTISITSPSANSPVLALDQPLTVAATVNYQGTAISGGEFTVDGTLTYSGASSGTVGFSRQLSLSDSASPGIYQARVTVPDTAPAGSYELNVAVSQISNTVISNDDRTLRLELFPVPLLRSPQAQGGSFTADPVQATVVQWDPVLAHLYDVGLAPVQWLGSLALDGHPAMPNADVPGQVELRGAPYADATVTGTASRKGSSVTTPVQVVNDGNGRFHVLFPSSADGTYIVTFNTTGSFEDSHGDLGTTHDTIYVTVVPATLGQEFFAYLHTLVYILLLVLLFLLIRYATLPEPVGEYTSAAGEIATPHKLKRNRSLWMRLRQRNLLPSKPSFGKDGLQLLVTRRGGIQARRHGRNGARWFDSAGKPLKTRFQRIGGVQYRPGTATATGSGSDDDAARTETYTFLTQPSRSSRRSGSRRRGGGGGGRDRRDSQRSAGRRTAKAGARTRTSRGGRGRNNSRSRSSRDYEGI